MKTGSRDVVRELGYLTLGTRLKRIGERLQSDTQDLLRHYNAALPVGQFPVLAALDELGPLSIGELALALGITQPAVTRLVGRLQADGVVVSDQAAKDRRVRHVQLSESGLQLVRSTKHSAWPAVEAAVADACADLYGPLLNQLGALEDALKEAPLEHRLAESRPPHAHRGLDNPVWASLATHQAHVATGDERVRRYQRDVNMFIATKDESEAAVAALAAAVRPGETVYVLNAATIAAPPELSVLKRAKAVQMVATRPMPALELESDIEVLTDEDAPEMLALATLTEPGPFLPRTHILGRFIGIRIEGRLAAMAGERMRLPGFTEVSGVCTHPDFRGRGLARRLSTAVAAHIEARYETPFLHSWRDNAAAIALYEKLGFRVRQEMNVAVFGRKSTAPAA